MVAHAEALRQPFDGLRDWPAQPAASPLRGGRTPLGSLDNIALTPTATKPLPRWQNVAEATHSRTSAEPLHGCPGQPCALRTAPRLEFSTHIQYASTALFCDLGTACSVTGRHRTPHRPRTPARKRAELNVSCVSFADEISIIVRWLSPPQLFTHYIKGPSEQRAARAAVRTHSCVAWLQHSHF